MKNIDPILLKKTVLQDNVADANRLRNTLWDENTYYINLMSSPGSGKTSTLVQIINRLKDRISIGVMEADIDSNVDAITIEEKTGVPAVQLHTGGMCHLDADMSRQGISALRLHGDKEINLIFLENVGNLVCPAEFDTGAHLNICILAIPEGHDKPLKYPLMFQKCSAVIVNKMDTLKAFDFDPRKFVDNVYLRNPNAEVFPVSAKTGDGFDELCDYIMDQIEAF